MPEKNPTEHERYRAIEAVVAVSVIDVADKGEICEGCGAKGLVFFVHCWREERRPIVALCKSCAVQRAGGIEKVYVKVARGPGLRKRWEAGERVAACSPAQEEALRRARAGRPLKDRNRQDGRVHNASEGDSGAD